MIHEPIEVSIVMPCLNEQETLGICIEKAQRTLKPCGEQSKPQSSPQSLLIPKPTIEPS